MADTWPGNRQPIPAFIFGRTSRSIDATTEMWTFFSAQQRSSL